MGSKYNKRVGLFSATHASFEFKGHITAPAGDVDAVCSANHLGRVGHVAFWHHSTRQLVMFGGQNNGSSGQSKTKTVMNDVLLYDIKRVHVNDQTVFSDIVIKKRTNHVGFLVDDTIYSIGGQDKHGNALDEFIEIDVHTKRRCSATVEKGVVPKVYSSAITPVFYLSKMGADGQLNLQSIAGEINWGEALDLIKYEGFYMFGGRDEHGRALNSLYVFSVAQQPGNNSVSGSAVFSVTQPQMSGQAPPARHSHTLNYVPKLGIVVIYGGRNDALGSNPILGDLWLITLANMEYQHVLIGGFSMPNPRYSHSSFVFGS